MAKVIAILDEPKSCMYCEFGSHVICGAKHNNMTSNAKFPEITKYDIYKNKIDETKPEWCPLIPLPERMKLKKDELYDEYADGYTDGWNSLLTHIQFTSEDGYKERE